MSTENIQTVVESLGFEAEGVTAASLDPLEAIKAAVSQAITCGDKATIESVERYLRKESKKLRHALPSMH